MFPRMVSRLLSINIINIILFSLIGGCSPSVPSVTPVASPSPTPIESPVPTPVQTAPVSTTMTLTVWLPEMFDPNANQPSAKIMLQQLTAFAASHPDTTIDVHLKKANGSGGLLDLLRTASPVAPAALPDIIMLSLTDLQEAGRLGTLQPLDSWLATGLATDLFPFAVSAGQVDGQWYGLPYAVDVEHLAYDTEQVTATALLSWTEIISKRTPYLFPVGTEGNTLPDDVLAQYIADGGTLTDARGQPVLDAAPLADTLRQFLAAYQAGVIPAEALRFTSTDETWPIFLMREMPLTNARASQYLALQDSTKWLGYAALPARSGPARPIARGWAWALVTRDPARQPRAASLMMWMMEADNNAAWTRAMNLLPARPSAVDRWGLTDPYIKFLRQELGRAVAPPPTSAMTLVGPAFQRALADVLAGKATPQDAAAAAITQLKSTTP